MSGRFGSNPNSNRGGRGDFGRGGRGDFGRGGGRGGDFGRGRSGSDFGRGGSGGDFRRGVGRGDYFGRRGEREVTTQLPTSLPSTSRHSAPMHSAAAPFIPADVMRGVKKLTVATETVAQTAMSESAVHAPSSKKATITPQKDSAETFVVTAMSGPSIPAPSSNKAMRHPHRPDFGTKGIKCLVKANHFLVQVADRGLFHYDVNISPDVTSGTRCRKIIKMLVDCYKGSNLGNLNPAYDGWKSLYTARELPFKSQQFAVNITENEREKEFKVSIRLVGKAELEHIQQFLLGRNFEAPQNTIQCLDIVLRQSPSNNYVSVSRSFFSTKFGNADIGDGVECWRGYYQSLRLTQMGLSFNIDTSATSFYKPLPVVDFVAECLNTRDVSRSLNDKQRITLKKTLKGLCVEVTHMKDIRRRYKIKGITTEPLNQLTFSVDDQGNKMRVVDYFLQKYSYKLRNLAWPCLIAGMDSKPIYLPMEVCKIVEGQRYIKKLSPKQVTSILKSTCQRPRDREKCIMDMTRSNNYENDIYVKEFGIQVTNAMTTVEARILPPPTLKYHDSGREKTCTPQGGVWNMYNKKMVNGGKIGAWACISFSRSHHDVVERFIHTLMTACLQAGMDVNRRPVISTIYEEPGNIESALKTVHDKAGTLQLLLVILPDGPGYYGKIKRCCETELGIMSQCLLPKNMQSCNAQYLSNVALKINIKVGGRNTVLDNAVSRNIPIITDTPTIIFGADVTHPSPGDDSSVSIAAVVASMDWPKITNYRAIASAQPRGEIINDLYTTYLDENGKIKPGGMIRELLRAFRRSTGGRRPERIIFYRDGVSEGEFNAVLLQEFDAINRACESLEEDYLPPITFVVVQKRHHTRFFPHDHGSNLADKSGNVPPGTVVDRQICHPNEFDFYLCSHAGIKGTSRPTHYHVLWDENYFSSDELQNLTNSLCYTYARCTRAVSIVPPAYYAHLAASRARLHLDGDSDAGTAANGPRVGPVGPRSLPPVMDNIKEFMFYC